MKENYVLKREAKEQLNGNRGSFAWLSVIPAIFCGVNVGHVFQRCTRDSGTWFDFFEEVHHFVTLPIPNVWHLAKFFCVEAVFHLVLLISSSCFLVWMMWLFLEQSQEKRCAKIVANFPLKQPKRFLGTLMIQGIYLSFWTLLLILPGCVKYYSYAMTYFILKEKGGTIDGAITRSRKLMHGQKFRLFLLDLSFFPWHVLNVCTLGAACLWTLPYILGTKAAFYRNLTEKKK